MPKKPFRQINFCLPTQAGAQQCPDLSAGLSSPLAALSCPAALRLSFSTRAWLCASGGRGELERSRLLSLSRRHPIFPFILSEKKILQVDDG